MNININSHYRSEGLVKWYPNFMTLQYTYRTYLIRKHASYGVCSESENYPSLHPWYTSFLWTTARTKAFAKTHQMRLTFLEEVKVETCGSQKGRMNKQTAVIICHVVLLFNFKQQFEPLPQKICFLLKIRIRFSLHVDLLILDPLPRWTKTEATLHCRTIGRLRLKEDFKTDRKLA